MRTVTADTRCCRHPAQRLISKGLHLVQAEHRASRGSCPNSDDFYLISPVAWPPAPTQSSLLTPRSSIADRVLTRSSILSSKGSGSVRVLRCSFSTGGRTIIFVRLWEFAIVIGVRYGSSSREADLVVCRASLRRMSRQLDDHEPHQRPSAFSPGPGRDEGSDTINLRPSVLLQPWTSAE
jgi:hypothetical protein